MMFRLPFSSVNSVANFVFACFMINTLLISSDHDFFCIHLSTGGQVVPDLAQLVQEFSGGSCFWVREIIQCIKDNGSEQFMQAVGENDNSNARECLFHYNFYCHV